MKEVFSMKGVFRGELNGDMFREVGRLKVVVSEICRQL